MRCYGFKATWLLMAFASAGWAAAQSNTAVPSADNPLRLYPDHATASVANLDQEIAWYERTLGFQEIGRGGDSDFQVVHLLLGDYRIDLAWQKDSSRTPLASYQAQGWMHVVFRTPDVDADYQRLVALGTDARADRSGEGTIGRIVLHDPEGNELEIVSSQSAAAFNKARH